MLSSFRVHWIYASPGWRGHFQDSLCTYFWVCTVLVVLHLKLLFVSFAKYLTCCLKVQLNFSVLHIIVGPLVIVLHCIFTIRPGAHFDISISISQHMQMQYHVDNWAFC